MDVETLTEADTRKHLVELEQAMRGRHMLACGIVRAPAGMFLHVIRVGNKREAVRLTARRVDGEAWFLWFDTETGVGDTIGTAEDASGVATLVERVLRERAEGSAWGPR